VPEQFLDQVYQGLRACLDLGFPKVCQGCGTVFHSLEDFISKTDELTRQHGLMDYPDRTHQRIIVGLYRNCRCQTTLMAVCDDRRDTSPNGQARRQQFENLLVLLEKKGLDRSIARVELLKMLHGEKSDLLETYGIEQHKFHEQLPH
jgi:hypothetical protein